MTVGKVGGDNSGCRGKATGIISAETRWKKAIEAGEEKKGLIM